MTESSAIVLLEDGSTIEAEFVIGTNSVHSRICPFIAIHSRPEFSGLMGVIVTDMTYELSHSLIEHGMGLPGMLLELTAAKLDNLPPLRIRIAGEKCDNI